MNVKWICSIYKAEVILIVLVGAMSEITEKHSVYYYYALLLPMQKHK